MIDTIENKIVKDILQLAELYKEDIPKGFQILSERNPQNLDALCDALCALFDEEEKMIQKEHEQIYVTNVYENRVRSFASILMGDLISFHEKLKEYEKYKVLCGKRHVAYGYYSIREIMPYEVTKDIDISYERIFYMGLVEFYNNFYGNFSDNEEAIELLCKFYPKEVNLKEYENEIAAALYTHISNAGTPNDFGYAYKGIGLIRKYIHNLPETLLYALLNEFSLYEIINGQVHRHQLFTIIEHGKFEMNQKNELKFWYLDSLLIANALDSLIIKKVQEEETKVEFHNNYYDYKLQDDKLIVFDEPPLYWGNIFSEDRVLYKKGRPYMKIQLKDQEIIVSDMMNHQQVTFVYEYSDWMLGTYNQLNVNKELKDLVFEIDVTKEMSYETMVFSLAYLDNYRGLHSQVIDFDHRFCYDHENNVLSHNTRSKTEILHIYGKSVYSLSCLVGRNAAGKTSIMDFLREAFFKFLKFIQEDMIPCENGYVEESKYEEYGILDKEAKFLVVFSIGTKNYFLTNMSGLQAGDVIPFHIGAYSSAGELSKVAYFSSQLRGDQSKLLVDSKETRVNTKQKISKVNNEFRQVDYSESSAFIRKRNGIEAIKDQKNAIVNKELCYQISLLRKVDIGHLYEELEIKEDKKFSLISQLDGKKKVEFSLEDMDVDIQLMENIKHFIKIPDASIGYFSAGQYAKFSFWAKLRWFLNGENEIREYNDLTEELVFSSDDVLLSGETALIFIDEGEIYYHPEWQRGYIKNLLDMVNDKPRKVQIIVTTNSPFMISDILSEDITYLSDDNKKEEKEADGTLGQNIHKLLKDNFFMKYTIGEYARELIENIMLCLQEESKEDKEENAEENEVNVDEVLKHYFDEIEDYYEAFRHLIEQIGEPVYKYNLKKMLEASRFAKQREIDRRIMELEEEKRKLQERIDILREMK